MKENRIFRTKQNEYWDIWSEHAIVFPKDMPLVEAFSYENIKKTIDIVVDDGIINIRFYFMNDNTVKFDVTIMYRNGYEEKYGSFEFVEMADVFILE